MAMKLNPITGEMEDDGIPAQESALDSNPVPDLTAPVPDQSMVESGGAPLGSEANPMNIAPRPKPPVEIEHGSTRVTETPAEKAAVVQDTIAQGEVLNAMERQGVVEQDEIGVKQQLDAEKVRLLNEHKKRVAEGEKEKERLIQERALKEKALVDDRATKQIQAGRAHADFVQKNFVGAIIGALVSSVAAGLHAMNGKGGLSPAERIMESAYANHEKALIAEYQASKQAKDDFDNDRPRFDANIAGIKVRVANEFEHDLKLALANADKMLSKLAPEKAAAAQAMKMALEKRGFAKSEFERTKGLRDRHNSKETLHPQGDGTSASVGKLTEGQANLAGALQDMSYAMEKFEGVEISQDSLDKIQDQQEQMDASTVKPGDGAVKPLVNRAMRGVGMLPRNKFEGVEDSEVIAYQNRERSIDQLNKTITGAAAADNEMKRRYEQWIIQPRDSDAVVKDKMNAFRSFVKNRIPLTGKAAGMVQEKFDASTKPDTKPADKKATAESKAKAAGGRFQDKDGNVFQLDPKGGPPIPVPKGQ
jgi:hypothetical protein